eukprot:m.508120 g.508120  ORF g.508120 m.508120 type:complete len:52 (+) comp88925_c0_seq1:131-286(+)
MWHHRGSIGVPTTRSDNDHSDRCEFSAHFPHTLDNVSLASSSLCITFGTRK